MGESKRRAEMRAMGLTDRDAITIAIVGSEWGKKRGLGVGTFMFQTAYRDIQEIATTVLKEQEGITPNDVVGLISDAMFRNEHIDDPNRFANLVCAYFGMTQTFAMLVKDKDTYMRRVGSQALGAWIKVLNNEDLDPRLCIARLGTVGAHEVIEGRMNIVREHFQQMSDEDLYTWVGSNRDDDITMGQHPRALVRASSTAASTQLGTGGGKTTAMHKMTGDWYKTLH